mmetsp:Transcript_49295/g.145576  ORF Transcript_49295/g.145576 Transcript_49295/m.145576 type:complete len:571 (-) Transcript_49295:106-1818(-)
MSAGLQSQLNRFAAPRSGSCEPPSVERRTDDSLPLINPTQDSLPQMRHTQDDLPRVDEMGILANVIESDRGARPTSRIAEGLAFAAENPPSSMPSMALVETEKTEEVEPPVALAADVTTVMIRPIPLKCSQRNMKKLLDVSGFTGEYDYLYVPMDQRMRANRGFAFVNFNTAAAAQRLYALFQGQIDKRFSATTTLQVVPATVQGFEENTLAYFAKGCRSSIQPIFIRPFSPAIIEKLNGLGYDSNVKQTGPKAANREERRDQAIRGRQQEQWTQQAQWQQGRTKQPSQDRPPPQAQALWSPVGRDAPPAELASPQSQVEPFLLESASKVPDGLLDRLVSMRGEGFAQQLSQPQALEESLEALARLRAGESLEALARVRRMDLRGDLPSHGPYPGHAPPGFSSANFDPFEVDVFDGGFGEAHLSQGLGQQGADLRQVERWLQSMESEMPGQALSKYMALRHGGAPPAGLSHPLAGQGASQGPARRIPVDQMPLRHPEGLMHSDLMRSELMHSDLMRPQRSDPMRGTSLDYYASAAAAAQHQPPQLDVCHLGALAPSSLHQFWSNPTTRRP